jgi:hypothetical protein
MGIRKAVPTPLFLTMQGGKLEDFLKSVTDDLSDRKYSELVHSILIQNAVGDDQKPYWTARILFKRIKRKKKINA